MKNDNATANPKAQSGSVQRMVSATAKKQPRKLLSDVSLRRVEQLCEQLKHEISICDQTISIMLRQSR